MRHLIVTDLWVGNLKQTQMRNIYPWLVASGSIPYPIICLKTFSKYKTKTTEIILIAQ